MEYLKIIALCTGLLIAVLFSANEFSESVNKHEVIYPESGVSCIVVSRMFNVSVDCWKE